MIVSAIHQYELTTSIQASPTSWTALPPPSPPPSPTYQLCFRNISLMVPEQRRGYQPETVIRAQEGEGEIWTMTVGMGKVELSCIVSKVKKWGSLKANWLEKMSEREALRALPKQTSPGAESTPDVLARWTWHLFPFGLFANIKDWEMGICSSLET